MPKEYKELFFTLLPNGEWKIDPQLQKITTFEQGNLLDNQDFGWQNFDLIVCRNVFIYFYPQATAVIVKSFVKALAQGGFLITGHGELQMIAPLPSALKSLSFHGSMVYQKVA